MPTTTYIPLANVTLSASAASVSFSSISQAYRDLILVWNTNETAGQELVLRMNGSSTASYTIVQMGGNINSSAGSSTSANRTGIIMNWDSSSVAARRMAIVNIFDYSATDKFKTCLVRQNDADPSSTGKEVRAMAGHWPSTAAITSLSIQYTGGGSISAGTTVALYGIAG